MGGRGAKSSRATAEPTGIYRSSPVETGAEVAPPTGNTRESPKAPEPYSTGQTLDQSTRMVISHGDDWSGRSDKGLDYLQSRIQEGRASRATFNNAKSNIQTVRWAQRSADGNAKLYPKGSAQRATALAASERFRATADRQTARFNQLKEQYQARKR